MKNNKEEFWSFVEKNYNEVERWSSRDKEGYEMLRTNDQANTKSRNKDNLVEGNVGDFAKAA